MVNFEQPPTATDSTLKVESLLEQAGIDSRYATIEFMGSVLFPCTASTFSDGEIILAHQPMEDPTLQEQFGHTRFDQGKFGTYLRELFEGPDEIMRGQVDLLIRQSAAYMAGRVTRREIQLPNSPTVVVDSAAKKLRFDKTLEADLVEQPKVVLDYGPGLQGRFHIHQQLQDWRNNRFRPYTHLALGKGPFINTFLQFYWKEYAGPRAAEQAIGKIYIGREDGMADASNTFIEGSKRRAIPVEIADIALASGIHLAGQGEIFTALRNAFTLLRPNGVLLVRAPKAANDRTTFTSAEQMVEVALDAGFSLEKTRFFNTITGSNSSGATASLSAVFRK
ncbi:MAG TPA: hypothetical protein VF733_01100 [Candidatus Saccharimonadales bacterium]